MATIYDVAKASGVSPKTVSRVLNGDAPVQTKTREAVEQAMTTLGYVPSNAARMMRSNKSGVVGLITGAISRSGPSLGPIGLPDLFIVQGIQKVMAENRLTVMITDTAGKPDSAPKLMRTLMQHRVEGLIYVAEYHQKVSLPDFAHDLPMVLVNCSEDSSTQSIVPDDFKGQYDLTSSLIEHGHRHIAYLQLTKDVLASDLRLRGYKKALEDHGISFRPELTVDVDHDGDEQGFVRMWQAIEGMLKQPEPPTVFACGNDKMAMQVYGLLRSYGVSVPEQVSVAGYDNYRVIAETLYPPLTTVELPYTAMGMEAARILIERIKKPGLIPSETSFKVGGPVIWRQSVSDLTQ